MYDARDFRAMYAEDVIMHAAKNSKVVTLNDIVTPSEKIQIISYEIQLAQLMPPWSNRDWRIVQKLNFNVNRSHISQIFAMLRRQVPNLPNKSDQGKANGIINSYENAINRVLSRWEAQNSKNNKINQR